MSSSIRPDLHPFLDRLTSHTALTDVEQAAFLQLPARPEQVGAHRDIVRLGERVDHACFIVAGLVGRVAQNANGVRQFPAVHIAGDMADLHSVVLPNATSALNSLSVSTILKVPHQNLRALIADHAGIAEAFWRNCMIDAAILAEWVVNVGRRDCRSRMAHLICELAVRLNAVDGSQFSFPLPVTQTELADITAMTAVHCNRTLQGLRAEDLIQLRSGMVDVQDWAKLQQVGDFDPTYLGTAAPSARKHRLTRSESAIQGTATND